MFTFPKLFPTACGLLLWSILVALLGCMPVVFSTRSASSVIGVWIREDDAYAGWVIEIVETEPGEYEARSVWVPNRPRELYSFQIGEKKSEA